MYVIVANFGNDSVSLIEWARQKKLKNVFVVWVDTGWAAPVWVARVQAAEKYIAQCGFSSVKLEPEYHFSRLVREQKNFPNLKFHWCARFLKGQPILDWLDQVDPERMATIMLAKRRSQSSSLSELPEFKKESFSYEERCVWHPLYQHTLAQRDQLIRQAGFSLLSTRSLECDPCIYNQRQDFLRLDAEKIAQLETLESEINRPMFFDKIKIVVEKAKQDPELFLDCDLSAEDKSIYYQGCGSEFGCGD